MNKRKREHDEAHTSELWLIPYADILTLLLALFIVLFASSQIDQKKFEELSRSLNTAFQGGTSIFEPSAVVPLTETGLRKSNDGHDLDTNDPALQKFVQETQELQRIKDNIDAYIEQNELTELLQTELDSEQLKITINDRALFDSGSAVVKPEAVPVAIAISEILEQSQDREVIVAGHTDNVPINTSEFPSNWDLSVKRAVNFMRILLQNENLRPENFSAVGYGEYHPVAPNDTAAGRAQNRRVEVSIIRNYDEPAPAADAAGR